MSVGARRHNGYAVAHDPGNGPKQEFGGGDRVAAKIAKRAAPCRIMAEAEGTRGGAGRFVIHIRQGVKFETEWQVKDLLGACKAEDMGLAHEARADEADATAS